MGFCLNILLVLVVTSATVLGMPNGAPDGACPNIYPVGHAAVNNMANDTFPYYVNISSLSNGYVPGRNYAIILTGQADPDFRGFLIQGRLAADGTTPAGRFVVENGAMDQQEACTMTAATHTNRMDKETVTLTWQAPASGTGEVLFRYAFVDVYETANNLNVYYANLTTAAVVEATLVTFSQEMYDVNENAGLVQPQLAFSSPFAAAAITVQVTTTDGTATGGEDYTSGPYPVIVPVNATTMSFNIAIINDTMDEGSEYFTLSIDQASLPDGFLVSDPYQARVTIRDDDGVNDGATGVMSSVAILLFASVIALII